jgi:hypothetical protein
MSRLRIGFVLLALSFLDGCSRGPDIQYRHLSDSELVRPLADIVRRLKLKVWRKPLLSGFCCQVMSLFSTASTPTSATNTRGLWSVARRPFPCSKSLPRTVTLRSEKQRVKFWPIAGSVQSRDAPRSDRLGKRDFIQEPGGRDSSRKYPHPIEQAENRPRTATSGQMRCPCPSPALRVYPLCRARQLRR